MFKYSYRWRKLLTLMIYNYYMLLFRIFFYVYRILLLRSFARIYSDIRVHPSSSDFRLVLYNKSEKFCRMCFVKEEFIWRRQNRCKQSTVFCFNINYCHKIVLQYDLMY